MTSTTPAAPIAPGESRPRPPVAGGRRIPTRLGVGLFALGCVAVAIVAPLPYLTRSLATMAEGNNGLASHYVDQPAAIRGALIAHAGASGLALLLTPLQLSARVRRRAPIVHRVAGRVSAVAILVGAAFGLVVAQVSYAGLVGTIGFSILAVLWAYTTVRSVQYARRGDLVAHRRWATRTVALSFAAVTLRLWLGVGIAVQMPVDDAAVQAAFDRVYILTPFLSWVPNLAVAEWLLWRRRRGLVQQSVVV